MQSLQCGGVEAGSPPGHYVSVLLLLQDVRLNLLCSWPQVMDHIYTMIVVGTALHALHASPNARVPARTHITRAHAHHIRTCKGLNASAA